MIGNVPVVNIDLRLLGFKCKYSTGTFKKVLCGILTIFVEYQARATQRQPLAAYHFIPNEEKTLRRKSNKTKDLNTTNTQEQLLKKRVH